MIKFQSCWYMSISNVNSNIKNQLLENSNKQGMQGTSPGTLHTDPPDYQHINKLGLCYVLKTSCHRMRTWIKGLSLSRLTNLKVKWFGIRGNCWTINRKLNKSTFWHNEIFIKQSPPSSTYNNLNLCPFHWTSIRLGGFYLYKKR